MIGQYPLLWLAWEVDADRRRSRFYCGNAKPIRHDLPIYSNSPVPRFSTSISVNGVKLTDIEIDSGNASELDILASDATRIGLIPVTDGQARWIWGPEVASTVKVDTLGLGPFRKRDRIASAHVDLPMYTGNGLLGMGILREFNFVLDPVAGWLQLTPRAIRSLPRDRSTTGLQVSPMRNGLHVDHVMLNSPANYSGIVTGDVICRIGDKRVTRSPEEIAHLTKPPAGKRIQLTLCSGKLVSFHARQFY